MGMGPTKIEIKEPVLLEEKKSNETVEAQEVNELSDKD